MTRTLLDIHILQTVPPSNLNRDDTGTPKSAQYGGVRRSRVSSQAWKRATRKAFTELLPPEKLGVRTKRVVEAVAERITAHSPELAPHADELAALILGTATGATIEKPKRSRDDEDARAQSAYLMFLSSSQLDALAEYASEGAAGSSPDAAVKALKTHLVGKEHKAEAKRLANTRHSVDIALFGRMVATAADLNVDAAVQVAHALGIHRSEIESDYYTAVDDLSPADESGAGMIGTVDFNSATLYRYAALDVDALHRNLGTGLRDGERPTLPAEEATAAFLEAFATSLPTGKATTFGHQTLPSAVVVKLRSRRPVSFVGAFEEAVPRGDERNGGFLAGGCARLTAHARDIEEAYGLAGDPGWVVRLGDDTAALDTLGERVTLTQLVERVQQTVARRLGAGG